MTVGPLFLLDGPQYQEVRPGEDATFGGIALAAGGDPVAEVVARSAGRELGRARPKDPTPELSWIPLAGSACCRFALRVRVPTNAPIEFLARLASGAEVPVFRYDVPFAVGAADRLRALAGRVASFPAPPSALVATTQGLGNVDAYRASIVGSLLAEEAQLEAAGAAPTRIRSVLDIGCGTGRLLLGWRADDGTRRLVGTDVNAELVAWANAALGDEAKWEVNGLAPPLAHPDATFDLVLLASVFTHLSLESQRAWVQEVRRLLAPHGRALVTLHGDVYAAALLREPAAVERWEAEGYAELKGAGEGENDYASFHSERAARALFSGFSDVAFFPRGATRGVPDRFPVASMQDVYVLTKGT